MSPCYVFFNFNFSSCQSLVVVAEFTGRMTGSTGEKKSTPVVRRIPITPRPTIQVEETGFNNSASTQVATSTMLSTKKLDKMGVKARGAVNKITSKFLSSSIASTNIMDTSDLPVTLVTSEVTTSVAER